MPVSVTVKRRRDAGRRPARRTTTSSRTEPSSVNLTALPARLISTWRRWPASPRSASGTSSAHLRPRNAAAWRAPAAAGSAPMPSTRSRGENSTMSSLSLPASIAEMSSTSSTSASSAARRGLDRVEALALLGVQARGRQQLGHARKPVERRAELVAHVGQEAALGLVGAARFVGRAGQRAQQDPTGTAAPRTRPSSRPTPRYAVAAPVGVELRITPRN